MLTPNSQLSSPLSDLSSLLLAKNYRLLPNGKWNLIPTVTNEGFKFTRAFTVVPSLSTPCALTANQTSLKSTKTVYFEFTSYSTPPCTTDPQLLLTLRSFTLPSKFLKMMAYAAPPPA